MEPLFRHTVAMDKRELAILVARRTGNVKADVELIIGEAIKAIRELMVNGETVTIRGFGTFKSTRYKAQRFTQPRTGEWYEKPPRRVPTFYPVKGFIAEVQATAIDYQSGMRHTMQELLNTEMHENEVSTDHNP
jgi:DNA-binding protein HU-beta